MAMVWAVWVIWTMAGLNRSSWLMATVSLAVVPVLGALAGPPAWPLLEVIIAPLLLYSMALGIVHATVTPSAESGPSALTFMAALGAIAAGSIVLLSMYYLDALFSLTLLSSNSDLMWPLSTLFLGTILISFMVRFSGLEQSMWAQKEVSG
jgi:hypothetical protein